MESDLFKVNGIAGTQTQVFLAPKLPSSSVPYTITSGGIIRLEVESWKPELRGELFWGLK